MERSAFETAPGDAPTMKAIVADRFGGPEVLELRDVPRPIPDDERVLIRVHASSPNPADWHRMTGTPYLVRFDSGLITPKRPVLGSDISGVVEEVGANVTRFSPGDHVFGNAGGAFAEYALGREQFLAHMPAAVSFEEAGTVGIAGHTALQAVRDHGRVEAGQRVLVNGASGGVGTFAVQIAAALGAAVTGVCSTSNVEMVSSLGAGEVIDYRTDDFTRTGRKFDAVIDIVGNRGPSEIRRLLRPGGRWVIVSGPKRNSWWGPIPYVARSLLSYRFTDETAVMFVAKENHADLVVMSELMEAGRMRPVIDRRFSLSETGDAMRHLGEGHSRGKSVIVVREA